MIEAVSLTAFRASHFRSKRNELIPRCIRVGAGGRSMSIRPDRFSRWRRRIRRNARLDGRPDCALGSGHLGRFHRLRPEPRLGLAQLLYFLLTARTPGHMLAQPLGQRWLSGLL